VWQELAYVELSLLLADLHKGKRCERGTAPERRHPGEACARRDYERRSTASADLGFPSLFCFGPGPAHHAES
jgi:hypothetical protein